MKWFALLIALVPIGPPKPDQFGHVSPMPLQRQIHKVTEYRGVKFV